MLSEIEELAEKGHTGAAISRALDATERFAGRVPTERTIQNIIRRLRPPDPEEAWHAADATDAEEAALILSVLAAVIRESEGRVKQISRRDAASIAKLGRVAGDLPGWALYRLARATEKWHEHAAGHFDILLAFAPWRGPGAWEAWRQADQAPPLSSFLPSPAEVAAEVAKVRQDEAAGVPLPLPLPLPPPSSPFKPMRDPFPPPFWIPSIFLPVWTQAQSHREMLEMLGFAPELIDQASSYAELLDIQRQHEAGWAHEKDGQKGEAT